MVPESLSANANFTMRVDAGIPVGGTPGLDDAFVGDELDLPADDEAAEGGECAAGFGADLRGWGACGHARLHGVAELDDALELFRVGESFVDALGAGCEEDFLVNGFGGVGDGLTGVCVSFVFGRGQVHRRPVRRQPGFACVPGRRVERFDSFACSSSSS